LAWKPGRVVNIQDAEVNVCGFWSEDGNWFEIPARKQEEPAVT
jgi:hypothetical protein